MLYNFGIQRFWSLVWKFRVQAGQTGLNEMCIVDAVPRRAPAPQSAHARHHAVQPHPRRLGPPPAAWTAKTCWAGPPHPVPDQLNWVEFSGPFSIHSHTKCVVRFGRPGKETSVATLWSPTRTHNSNPRVAPSGSNPTDARRRDARRRTRHLRHRRRATGGAAWRPGVVRSRCGGANRRRRTPPALCPATPPSVSFHSRAFHSRALSFPVTGSGVGVELDVAVCFLPVSCRDLVLLVICGSGIGWDWGD
jgi:hypothetical protein